MEAKPKTTTGARGDPTPRLEGEGPKAFEAFLIYRDMGRGRSLEAVRKSSGEGSERSLRLMERWSGQWRWVERCRGFDDRMEAIRRTAREAEAAKWAGLWERRKHQAIEDAYLDAELLRKKARQMLKFPVGVAVESRDGKTTVKPGRWSFDTAARILGTVAALQSAVFEATTPQPVEAMTDAELDAVFDAAMDARAAILESRPPGDSGPPPVANPADSPPR